MTTDATVTDRRFPQLRLDALTAEQSPVADDVLTMSSLGIKGPYNVMLRSPAMAAKLLDLLRLLRFHTTVPHHLNEFAILIQARLWTSSVEWLAHHPIALKAGLPGTVLDELRDGRRPTAMSRDVAAVYDFSIELSTTHAVSEPTYAVLRDHLDNRQIVDLTTAIGAYVTTAMLLAVGEEPTSDGPAPLPPLDR